LPPKATDISFNDPTVWQKLEQRRPASVTRISSTPVIYSSVRSLENPLRFEFLSKAADEVLEVSAAGATVRVRSVGTQVPAVLPAEFRERDPEGLSAFRYRDAMLLLEGSRVHLIDGANRTRIWALDLGFVPLGVSRESPFALTFWRTSPNRLYLLRDVRAPVQRIRWSEDSEIVAFLPCAVNQQVLVENLFPAGLTRLTYFVGGELRSYTLVDSSDGQRKSDVSAAFVGDRCATVHLLSAHGISRVSYTTPL
jgi:hypothetical protein